MSELALSLSVNPSTPLPRGPTGRRTPPPPPPLAATTGLPPPMEATPTEEEDPIRVDGPANPPPPRRRHGSPLEDFIATQDVLQWVGLLNSLTTFGGDVDPLDVVVVNRVLACPEDGLEIDQAIFRYFKGGISPECFDLKGGVSARIWYRTGRKKGFTLTSGKVLVQRSYKGRSFAWLSSLAAAWPPL
jgi:hypothetical protein